MPDIFLQPTKGTLIPSLLIVQDIRFLKTHVDSLTPILTAQPKKDEQGLLVLDKLLLFQEWEKKKYKLYL